MSIQPSLDKRESLYFTIKGESVSHITVDIGEKASDITEEKFSPTSLPSYNSHKIDAIRFSCNNKYAVSYSSESKGFIVWRITADSIERHYTFTDGVAPAIMEDKWDIYLDVSPDGKYVAASIFSSEESEESKPPPMKIYYYYKSDPKEIYKPPKHMENLQGHGVFSSLRAQTFILCTDRWPWPNINARIVIYDINNNWAIVKQLKTGYDFTWPIRWPMKFPPSFRIRLVVMEKTNVSNLFPRGARDHIANGGGLARAIAQEALMLRSKGPEYSSTDAKRPEYYLQSWSIMTGSPQQSMDLRYLSDTIPILSDNGLYKAARTQPLIKEKELREPNPRRIRVFSAVTGCELAIADLGIDDENILDKNEEVDDWQPVRFVGIADQVLIIRNQHGEIRLWRFMVKSEQPVTVAKELETYGDHPTKPKRMNSITTPATSDSTFLIATTILQRPAVFRIIAKGDALNVEKVIVPDITAYKFDKIEKCTIYTRPQILSTKVKESKAEEYDIEPWVDRAEYKGWVYKLGTDGSRYIVVGRSTVQLYSKSDVNGKSTASLEFIWTMPIDAKMIYSVEISKDHSGLKITYILDTYHYVRSKNISTRDIRVDIDGLKEIVDEKLAEESERIEIIPLPPYGEKDHDSFYISSSLLNSLKFFIEKKMERSWRRSSPFCQNILDHAYFYLAKHPLMLFNTVQQFTIRAPWSTKTADRIMNKRLSELIKDLDYVPTIDHTVGTDLLSVNIKNRNTKLVFDLVDYFMTRAIQGNIGFMIPITGSFKSLLKHYPEKAIEALKKTCFINIGDAFTGSSDDFLTVPAYGIFQIRENVLLADTARIFGATIFLAIAFPLSVPTVILPILSILLPLYLRYKKKESPENFIGWIKQTLNEKWKSHYPDSWVNMTISKLKLFFWQADHERQKFVFPLPNLCVYYHERSSFHEWFFPSSPFTEICDAENADLFGLPIWKGLLDFKWRSFARSRYYFLWALHCVILILFAYASKPTMTSTVYTGSYSPLYILIILSLFFLLSELRQVLYYSWRYFLSPYNYVDVIAFVLVIWCVVPMLDPSSQILASKNSITMLILWIRFLLHTRIYRAIGIFVNVVIDVLYGIIPFLFVLTLTLLGFSHAFWILLGSDPDISPNYFTTYRNSTKYAFLALTGDPIGLSSIDKENTFSDTYRAIYSIFTVIVLFNILIALLNNRYQSAYERSRDVYTLQMAQIIAEIEIFFMAPWERQNSLKFPSDLIYEVEVDKIKKYKLKLEAKNKSTEERIMNLEKLAESSNSSGKVAADAEVQYLKTIAEKDHEIIELYKKLNKSH